MLRKHWKSGPVSQNYCPISQLPEMSINTERIITEIIQGHTEGHGVFPGALWIQTATLYLTSDTMPCEIRH